MKAFYPYFDPDEWRVTSHVSIAGQPAEVAGDYISIQSILGPLDACKAEWFRKKLDRHVHIGNAIPAEVFIMAVGDPPSREHTKIGGRPYWPKSRDWLESENGRPLTFVAQFNCAHSAIASNAIPNDIILIFADIPTYREICIKTVSFLDDDALISIDNVPPTKCLPALYGCKWLTHNYPEWQPLDDDVSEIRLDDGATVLDPFLVFQLLGMQIGSAPFTPPDGILEPTDERILCSVCSVMPKEGVRYPFLNHPVPLTDAEVAMYTIHLTEAGTSTDGIGIIYGILRKDGSLRSHYHIFGR